MKKQFTGMILLILIYLSVAMSSAQSESSQTFFDFITHPDCENYCWMGIEPGVTAFEDVEDILIANGMNFTYTDAMFNSIYIVDWMDTEAFATLEKGNRVAIDVHPGETVSDIMIDPENLTVDDVLNFMPDVPDLIEIEPHTYIYYEAPGIQFNINDEKITAVHLLSSEATNSIFEIVSDGRPCDEPAFLCNIPISSDQLNERLVLHVLPLCDRIASR